MASSEKEVTEYGSFCLPIAKRIHPQAEFDTSHFRPLWVRECRYPLTYSASLDLHIRLLLMNAEFFEQCRLIAPVGFDLHKQLQVAAMAQ